MTEHFEFTKDENGKVISMGEEKNESGWVFDEASSKNKGADLACKYGSGFNATSNQVFNMQIDSFIDGSLWQFHQCKAKHESEIKKVNELIEKLERSLSFYSHPIKYEPIRQNEIGSVSWDEGHIARQALEDLKAYREGK